MGSQGITVGRVVKGGFWLYLSSIVSNIQGFFYWLIISKVAGAGVLGLTTAIIGLGSLIAGVLSLGIPTGVQKFLGKCLGENDRECMSRYFWSSLFFTMITYVTVGAVIMLAGTLGIGFSKYTPEMLKLAGALVCLSWASTFQALFQSMLRTKIIFLATSVAAALKFIVGVSLVLAGYGWLGAVAGYLASPLALLVMYLWFTSKTIGLRLRLSLSAFKETLIAGVVSWLPGVIVLFGQWLGVLVVFGSKGNVETGYYFVAFMIAQVVLMIASSMIGLLLPVLSGMKDGRKRAGSRVLRISLAIMMPVAFYIMAYPSLLLCLLGKEYASASMTLIVLLAGLAPLVLSGVITCLCYAYNMYREVLFIGLAQNIPRVILYLVLVPKASGLGAAASFTIGSVIGCLYSFVVARKIGFIFEKKVIGLTVLIPGAISLVCYILEINWAIAMLLVASSYLLYIKIGVITRKDLKEITLAFLSREKALKLYEKLRPIIEPILS